LPLFLSLSPFSFHLGVSTCASAPLASGT
jgi:hypothetical protein